MRMRNTVSVLVLFILIFIVVETFTFSAEKIGRIAYSTRGTGYKIWVMDEDCTNHHQLTFGPGVDLSPRWSPDGSKIAFNSNRDTGYEYEIFVMDADGTNMQKIVSIPFPGSNCSGQDWTPDGEKVGFTANYGSNNNSILWVNADGTGKEPIYDAHSKVDFCSFSTDGNKILFIHWGELYIMNLDGTGKTKIGNAQRADWLPNQDMVVYVDQSTYRDIWIVNPITLDRNQLTFEYPRKEFFLDPEWSRPDAQKIVYNRAGDLWIMNSDGSNKIQLTFDGIQGEGSGELYYFDINSPPYAAPNGGGVFEINEDVTLGGYVSDFDGDLLSYQWLEGTTVLFSGTVQSINGGTLVELPGHTISTFPLGIHSIVLQVDDGANEPVSEAITVEIVDNTTPTLEPAANTSSLWPPNHKMIDIVIEANASDNSGLPVTLSAVISSNEPVNGSGDGDMSPDWTEPVIDRENGIITFKLRAERSGNGNGRVYTITITATDTSNNIATANVEITVPHDKKKR